MKSYSIIVLLSLAVLVAAIYFGIWLPLHFRGKQVADVVLLREYRMILDGYCKAHGSYPETLQLVIPTDKQGRFKQFQDNWGNPVTYVSDGHSYLLVTYGKDGLGDGVDYRSLRENNNYQNVCGSWNADQVVSDRGEHRTCGK